MYATPFFSLFRLYSPSCGPWTHILSHPKVTKLAKYGRSHTTIKGWTKVIKLGQIKKYLFIQLHTENRSRKRAGARVGSEERNAEWEASFRGHCPERQEPRVRRGWGQFAFAKTGKWVRKRGKREKGLPKWTTGRLRGRTRARLGWGKAVKCGKGRAAKGVPSQPSPQLTKHEHRTMTHHGGAMQSRVPRAGGTGRTFWRERTREKPRADGCLLPSCHLCPHIEKRGEKENLHSGSSPSLVWTSTCKFSVCHTFFLKFWSHSFSKLSTLAS